MPRKTKKGRHRKRTKPMSIKTKKRKGRHRKRTKNMREVGIATMPPAAAKAAEAAAEKKAKAAKATEAEAKKKAAEKEAKAAKATEAETAKAKDAAVEEAAEKLKNLREEKEKRKEVLDNFFKVYEILEFGIKSIINNEVDEEQLKNKIAEFLSAILLIVMPSTLTDNEAEEATKYYKDVKNLLESSNTSSNVDAIDELEDTRKKIIELIKERYKSIKPNPPEVSDSMVNDIAKFESVTDFIHIYILMGPTEITEYFSKYLTNMMGISLNSIREFPVIGQIIATSFIIRDMAEQFTLTQDAVENWRKAAFIMKKIKGDEGDSTKKNIGGGRSRKRGGPSNTKKLSLIHI